MPCVRRLTAGEKLLGGVFAILVVAGAVTVATAGVVTQYGFDGDLLDTGAGGAFVDDLTGYNTSQTVTAATFQPGIVGQAVELGLADGLANVLSAADSDDLDLAGDYTLEMFVHPQPEHGNHWHRLAAKWFGGDMQWHFALNYPTDGLDLFMNGGNIFDGQSTAPVPANAWSHVAFTGDSAANETKIWYNGTVVGTSTYVAVNGGGSPLELGNYNAAGQAGLQYSGLIDEFAIHDTAVDAAYMQSRAAMLPDVLTWDGSDNSWGDASHWDGPAAPTILNPAVIPGGTVTVAAPAEAHDLTVSAGGVAINPGQSLTLYQAANFAPGTTLDLGAGATLSAGGGSIARLNTAGNSVVNTSDDMTIDTFHDGGTTGIFTKQGRGTLALSNVPDGSMVAADTTLKIEQGTLSVRGTDPVGGSQSIELAGGVLQLTNVGAPDPPASGLLAYWEFEDPADIGYDSANPTRTYTAIGSVGHTTEGFAGGALSLSGASHLEVDVPDATTTYTIGTWVKMDPAAVDLTWHNVAGDWVPGWMHLGYDSGGTFGDFGGGQTSGLPADGAVQGDRWYHLVSVRDGVANKLYIDGIQVSTSAGVPGAPSGVMGIGTARPGAGSLWWVGMIDDMALYNRALSDEEVTGWYDGFFGGISVNSNLLVTADSTIRVEASSASLGALTMRAGALSTTGSAAEVTFTSTTIAAGAEWVGFDPQVPTKWNGVSQDMDGIDAANVQDVTIAKVGPSTWTVSQAPQNLAATADFEVAGGVLELRGTDTFGGRDIKVSAGTLDIVGGATLGDSPIELAGGRLAVAAPIGAPIPPVGGLVANWQFEDPADLGLDSVNAARTRTEIGSVGHAAAGRVGGALQLNGSGYLDVGSDGFTPTYAVAAWLNVGSGAAGWRTAMGDWPSGWMHFGLDDVQSFGDHSGGRTSGFPVGGVVQRDTWYHVVSIRDGMENQLWINGVKASQTSSGTPGAPAATVAIGSTGATARNQWIGMIDELYVYDRSLSPEEVGNWFRGYLGAVDLSATDVTVTADSEIDVDGLSAGFGDLTMAESAVLTTSGALEGIGFARTMVAAGVDRVSFDTQANTLPGAITAEGVTIVKQGPADLVLDSPGSSLTDVKFDVQEGRLVGYHGSNPFGPATLNLNGGEVLLSAKAGAASPVSYLNSVTVATDGVLTAGQGSQGADAPMTVELGSPAGDAVTLSDGASVTLRSTDAYELNVLGPVNGAGGLSVTEGTVTLAQGGNVSAMEITGGSLTLGADLNVATGNLREGVVNTGASKVVVSQSMKLGLAATLGIDAGNMFDVSGSDVLTAAEVGLSGGRFTITGPPGGLSAPTEGMVARWRFEDPAELGFDSVDPDRTSTEVGTPAHEPAGRFGGALALDGNSHLELSIEGFSETYSISGWLNVAEGVANGWRTAAGNWDTQWMHYGFQPAGNFGDHGGGETSDFPPGGVVERDTWYHVVSIRDGMENQLWIDGVKAAQTSAGMPVALLGPFYIGTKDSLGRNHWMGMIDELYVYDRALTPEEVAELANPAEAPGAIDLPGASFTVTASTDVVLDTTLPATLGNLALDAGVTLSISGAEVAVGNVSAGHDAVIAAAMAIRGTLSPGDSTGVLTLDPGPGNWVEFDVDNGSPSYHVEIAAWDEGSYPDPWDPIPPTGAVNDLIVVATGTLGLEGELNKSTLNLTAISQLGPDDSWFGTQTRTIIQKGQGNGNEEPIDGEFEEVPVGKHLGYGVFVAEPGVEVTLAGNMEVTLLQALAGDTNGDRVVDIANDGSALILNLGTQTGMSWTDGDFNHDQAVDIGNDGSALILNLGTNYKGRASSAGKDVSPGEGGGFVEQDGSIFLEMNELALYSVYVGNDAGEQLRNTDALRLDAGVNEPVWALPPFSTTNNQVDSDVLEAFEELMTAGNFITKEPYDTQVNVNLAGLTGEATSIWMKYQQLGQEASIVMLFRVPEPGTLVMLLAGLIGLALAAWRRRAA